MSERWGQQYAQMVQRGWLLVDARHHHCRQYHSETPQTTATTTMLLMTMKL